MKEYSPSQIKNIVVLGHQGSGKTSLMESVLLKSNTIAKKGSVDAGTSTSDYTKEEKNGKTSIYSSVLPVEYRDNKFNFIDTPGFFDFQIEVKQALRAARSAILVIDASKGVEVGTVKHWNYLRKKGLPSIILLIRWIKTILILMNY